MTPKYLRDFLLVSICVIFDKSSISTGTNRDGCQGLSIFEFVNPVN